MPLHRLITLTLILGSPLMSQISINVPGQFPTIQAAIAFAVPGDTILVLPGTYPETIDFLGKDIRVISRDGPGATTIDAGQNGTVARFTNGEPATARFEGFRLTNGAGAPGDAFQPAASEPGGILIEDSSPTIVNCVVDSCTGGIGTLIIGAAGGCVVRGVNAAPRFERCTFEGNTGGDYLCAAAVCGLSGGDNRCGAGGLQVESGRAVLESCLIRNNQGSMLQGIFGNTGVGGLRVDELGDALLRYCSIIGNQGGMPLYVGQNSAVGGIDRLFSVIPVATRLTMESCIVQDNLDAAGSPADVSGNSPQIQASFSNIGGGWPGTGNIDLPPLFLPGTARLSAASPCVDAGDPATASMPFEVDIEGRPRVFYGGVDMGANEYLSACFDGNVGVPQGMPQSNLLVNSDEGPLIRVALGQNIEVRVLQPSTNPNPANFLVFGAFGAATQATEFGSGIGTLCFPPSVGLPNPGLFLLASSFAPATGLVGATPAPWSWTLVSGIAFPATFSFQGLIVQSAGGGQNLGITNGMIVEVF